MKQLKDGDIDEITLKINTRPRKELNFTTPIEEYFNYLLLIYTCLLNSPAPKKVKHVKSSPYFVHSIVINPLFYRLTCK